MNEVFEKIIGKLENEKKDAERLFDGGSRIIGFQKAIEIVEQAAKEYKGGWIPVSERLPEAEKEVLILAKREWKDGNCRYIITTAMYEDGTMLDNDSCWYWEDIDGEWDEEEDCMIIPEGWWENKHYHQDGELNHEVDDEVVAWQPLPEPYKGEQP